MRIAFYAPLKAPTHAVPSGDRRMAGLIMTALETAGHAVDLASTEHGDRVRGRERVLVIQQSADPGQQRRP